MTSEKLYALACENLKTLCYGYAKECSMGPGEEVFSAVKAEPEKFARWHPALAAAIEIYTDARESVLKSKGGSVYSAVKKLVKSVPSNNSRMSGAWVDAEDRQCFCDGYRAVRLKNHVDGFDEVTGMDLYKVWPDTSAAKPLPLPTPGEVKACIAEQKGRVTAIYDFGEGLPRVNAKYLQNMMDILPGATAKVVGINNPIVFESDAGDGLLLPIHKNKSA